MSGKSDSFYNYSMYSQVPAKETALPTETGGVVNPLTGGGAVDTHQIVGSGVAAPHGGVKFEGFSIEPVEGDKNDLTIKKGSIFVSGIEVISDTDYKYSNQPAQALSSDFPWDALPAQRLGDPPKSSGGEVLHEEVWLEVWEHRWQETVEENISVEETDVDNQVKWVTRTIKKKRYRRQICWAVRVDEKPSEIYDSFHYYHLATIRRGDTFEVIDHRRKGLTLASVVDDVDALVGAVMPFATNTNKPPAGWLECDGSQKSVQEFPRLFEVIGTRFGNGNGDGTKFNLPDLRGRFVRGWWHPTKNDLIKPEERWCDPDYEGRRKQDGRPWPIDWPDKIGSVQEDAMQEHDHSLGGIKGTATGGDHKHDIHTSGQGNWYRKRAGVITKNTNWGHEHPQTDDSGRHTHTVNIDASASTGGGEPQRVHRNAAEEYVSEVLHKVLNGGD